MVSLCGPEFPGAETLASGATSAAAGTLCFGLPAAFEKRGDSAACSFASGSAGDATSSVTTTSGATTSVSTWPGGVCCSDVAWSLSFWCPGASALLPGGSLGGAANADPHGSVSVSAMTATRFRRLKPIPLPSVPLKGHAAIAPLPEGLDPPVEGRGSLDDRCGAEQRLDLGEE